MTSAVPSISNSGPSPALQAAMDALMLASGETTMMITDGITEARRAQAFLSIRDAAARVGKAGTAASLRKLSHTIYRGAWDFEGGRPARRCLPPSRPT